MRRAEFRRCVPARLASRSIALALIITIFHLPAADDGGTVRATVIYDGQAPEPKPLKTWDADCKRKEVINESLVVDTDTKAIKWTIVRIMVDPKSVAPTPDSSIEIDQKECKYTPHVVIAAPGQRVKLLNPDGISHNPHVLDSPVMQYTDTLDQRSEIIKEHLKDPGIYRLRCDVHTCMAGLIVVHDPRYCAVTGADGKFEIKNVPPGKYTLKVFHEKCGEKTLNIDVKSGVVTDLGTIPMKIPGRNVP